MLGPDRDPTSLSTQSPWSEIKSYLSMEEVPSCGLELELVSDQLSLFSSPSSPPHFSPISFSPLLSSPLPFCSSFHNWLTSSLGAFRNGNSRMKHRPVMTGYGPACKWQVLSAPGGVSGHGGPLLFPGDSPSLCFSLASPLCFCFPC